MKKLNPFPTSLLPKIKFPNHAHFNLNKSFNFEKFMKIYFQLKISKYLILSHICN